MPYFFACPANFSTLFSPSAHVCFLSFLLTVFLFYLVFPLSIIACTDGDLFLSNGTKGRVEVCWDGEWGTVCDHDWDLNDGGVACRQRGFLGVVSVYHSSYFGSGTVQVLMDNVQCVGNESRLVDCPFKGWGITDCSDQEIAGVECSGELSGPALLH